MEQLQQLEKLFGDYRQKVIEIRKKSRFFDGVFGLGDDPKKNPCHEAFYQAVKEWVDTFAASSPSPETANAAVSFLLETPAHNRESESYWFMYAVMAFIDPLIPYLNKEDAKVLAKRMNLLFPRYDRMPAHQAAYKKLLDAGK